MHVCTLSVCMYVNCEISIQVGAVKPDSLYFLKMPIPIQEMSVQKPKHLYNRFAVVLFFPDFYGLPLF